MDLLTGNTPISYSMSARYLTLMSWKNIFAAAIAFWYSGELSLSMKCARNSTQNLAAVMFPQSVSSSSSPT